MAVGESASLGVVCDLTEASVEEVIKPPLPKDSNKLTGSMTSLLFSLRAGTGKTPFSSIPPIKEEGEGKVVADLFLKMISMSFFCASISIFSFSIDSISLP